MGPIANFIHPDEIYARGFDTAHLTDEEADSQ